jgi:transcriptional regulator with XRE-family HTH domain
VNSERLRQLRHDNVMTQKELAEAAKVGVRTVAALENGETSAQPRTIRTLAGALGVPPRELVAENN